MTTLEDIEIKFDQIIGLLQSIQQNQPISVVEIPGISDTNICNCGQHKRGEATDGWHCPEHGQCF